MKHNKKQNKVLSMCANHHTRIVWKSHLDLPMYLYIVIKNLRIIKFVLQIL